MSIVLKAWALQVQNGDTWKRAVMQEANLQPAVQKAKQWMYKTVPRVTVVQLIDSAVFPGKRLTPHDKG